MLTSMKAKLNSTQQENAQTISRKFACVIQGCKNPTTVAAHGIRHGKLYDEDFCELHWNRAKLDRFKPTKERIYVI